MTTTTTLPNRRLRPLDPNLPLLAAQAAVELDAVRLSKGEKLEAFKELRDLLENSFIASSGNKHRHLVDPGTEAVLTYSLSAARMKPADTREELVEQAWELLQNMITLEEKREATAIESLRDFCVALSERAAAYRDSFEEVRRVPPYRR
jgi:hypothetical protein